MGAALQPARAGQLAGFSYARRRPEDTTLYQVVQEEIETFLAQVEAQTGSSLPEFVKDEFEAFLECGIPRLRGGGAYWRTVSSGCAVASAPTRSWWRIRASGVGSAPRAARGA